jgi:hypothetical protein
MFGDGGMYPISMLDKLPLKQKGLKISNRDIFNADGDGGLVRAIVQIGGCTGSFVSGQGLIITNHHCAFSSLAVYNTVENNLFAKGYLAPERRNELPIKGMTCRILESFKDVSEEIIKGTLGISDGIVKQNIIDKNLHLMTSVESMRNPGLEIKISEMLPGKSYILFRYNVIKDVRIVYIPARNIGEFGGETDNWEWPRHNGDFSFLRAYVNKDGKSALYNTENIPYEPKEFLNINKKGVVENDFVFILGFPGRTYRNQPSAFLNLQQQFQLPYISKLFYWQIAATKSLGKYDKNWLMGKEPRLKSLANVAKNYAGKLKGFENLNLYQSRKIEEREIISMLQGTDQSKFKNLLRKTDSVYILAEKSYKEYLWFNQIFNESNTLKLFFQIANYQKVIESMKGEVPDSLKSAMTNNLRQIYKSKFIYFDSMYIHKMLSDASNFENPQFSEQIRELTGKVSFNKWITEFYNKSKIFDSTFIFNLIENKPSKLSKLQDPMLKFCTNLYRLYNQIDSTQKVYKAEMDALLPQYVDLKMKAQDGQFIPDANLTLRITYGFIKGYTPSDGIYCEPFTTVYGMLEKGVTGVKDYSVNEELKTTWLNYSIKHPDAKKSVPVCMLYNTDTTGGNSGSPILDQYGQLIGLNFDRTFEATINDYAWDDKYSRSIGVDARFILWTLKYVAHADDLLKEMYID